MDSAVEDLLDAVLGDITMEERRKIEADGFAPELWERACSVGAPSIGVPEEVGGAGGDTFDAAEVCRAVGRNASPVPLVEAGFLAGWLLGRAGIDLPGGVLTTASSAPDDRVELNAGNQLAGRLRRVPWGRAAARIAVIARGKDGAPYVVVLDPARGQLRHGSDLAGQPCDALDLNGYGSVEQLAQVDELAAQVFRLRGALSRALMLGGSAEALVKIAVRYAWQREQFGKPIASFQAVANRLVCLAAEAEAANAAATQAVDYVVRAEKDAHLLPEAEVAVASAKVNAARSAAEASAHAHQVHGAIGMTQEYPLHYFTRRIAAWRQEWGSEGTWAEFLGKRVAEAGASGMWSLVAHDLVSDR